MRSRQGISLVEILVALVLLGVGVLGGLGSLALAWRTALNGDHLAASARQGALVVDSLRAGLAASGGHCGAIGAGRDSGAAGTLTWLAAPAPRGLALTLQYRYATIPVSGDTGWSFFPCRP